MSTTTADFFRVSATRRELEAWSFTILGVFCFSFTFPMTRLALVAFDPVMIALARGAGAGSAALLYLVLSRSRVPEKAQLLRIAGAAVGMVILFPLLVSTALRFVPATHASVVAAILPLMTALFGVIRGRETGTPGFWVSAAAGSVLIALFCGYRSGFHGIDQADLLLLVGFVACSYGYAEGGLLARELGGWQVICWVLVIVLPVELTGLIGFAALNGVWVHPPSASAWIGIAYLTLISQFIGFYFYYKGLGLGGVAKMSQAQLLLPFLAIFASGLLLGEEIDRVVMAGAAAITGIVFVGRWSLRQRTSIPSRSDRRLRATEQSFQGTDEPQETVASPPSHKATARPIEKACQRLRFEIMKGRDIASGDVGEMRPYQSSAIGRTGLVGADLRVDHGEPGQKNQGTATIDQVGGADSELGREQLLRPVEDRATLMVWLLLILASMASLLLAALELFGQNF